MANTNTKARYWVAVCYPENMIPDWQDEIEETLQVPYAYCVHDKGEEKTHVHIMIAYGNTTTYKTALSVFEGLSAEGKDCCNTCQQVKGVRYMYNYLIHDTDACRQKGKHLYEPSERITGCGFDIDSYDPTSISPEEKENMKNELLSYVVNNSVTDYLELVEYAMSLGKDYISVLTTYNSFLNNVVVGVYRHIEKQKRENYDAQQERLKLMTGCHKIKHREIDIINTK